MSSSNLCPLGCFLCGCTSSSDPFYSAYAYWYGCRVDVPDSSRMLPMNRRRLWAFTCLGKCGAEPGSAWGPVLPMGFFLGPCRRPDHDDPRHPCYQDSHDYLHLVERICRRCRRHVEAQNAYDPEQRKIDELNKRGILGFYYRLRFLTEDPYRWEYLVTYEPYAQAQEHVLYTVLDGWRRGRPTEAHKQLYRRFFDLLVALPRDERLRIPDDVPADASSPEFLRFLKEREKLLIEDRRVFRELFYNKRKGR